MVLILIFSFLCLFSVPSRGEIPVGDWETYLHSNDIRNVVTDGTTVWAIPHYGGLIECNTETKTTRLYTKKDGLLSNAVSGAVLDRNNHLWIYFGDRESNGSADGFMVYDAGSWTTYTTADGLIDNTVTAIAIDSTNVAWIGTETGVTRFDGSTWTSYDHFEMDGEPDPITSIICGTDGTIYVATRYQYWQYKNDTWTSISIDYDKRGLDLLRAMPDSSLLVRRHVGMGIQEIYTLKNMQRTTIAYFGRDPEWLFGVYTDDENNIWLEYNDHILSGSYQATGYLCYDGQDTTRVTNLDDVPYYIGHEWVKDHTGRRWVATSEGMIVHENDRTDTLRCDGIAGHRIMDIMFENHGYPILTTGHGISTYTGTRFTTHSDMRRNDLLSAVYTADGIWAGTTDGIAMYGDEGWQQFYTVGEDSIKRVPSIIEDRTGVIWALSEKVGLVELINGEIISVNTDTLRAIQQVNCIAVDSTNTKWIGGGCGLLSYDGTAWHNHTAELNELGRTGLMRAITVDPDNQIWVLSLKQIFKYDGNDWSLLSPDIVESDSQDFRSIAVDRDGVVWVGTFGNGVLCYDGTHWQQFTTLDGLTDDHVISIAVDSENHKWFGTYYGGITAFTPQTIPAVDSTLQCPESFLTVSVYPNPFNPSTTLSFTLSEPANTNISIYNLAGQKIRALLDSHLTTGSNNILWDGCDDTGSPVSSGIYFARIVSGDKYGVQKMMLMK